MTLLRRTVAAVVTLCAVVVAGELGTRPGLAGSPAAPDAQRVTTTTLRVIPSFPSIPFPSTTRPPATHPPRTTTTTSTTVVVRRTTTTTAPTTTTTTTTPPVRETTTTVPPAEGEEPVCAYRNDLVIATQDLTARMGALGLAVPTGADVPNLDPTALRLMGRGHVYPYRITSGADPLAVAQALVSSGVIAAPVMVVLPAGHWTYAGGNPPVDLPDPAPVVPGAPAKPVAIAEIDTGYSSAAGDPAWLSARVKAATALDGDKASAAMRGHGKFVASIITQERPNSTVTVGGITPVPAAKFTGDSGRPFPAGLSDVSDELQVWLTMRRVLGTGQHFTALNMSVGAYACPLSYAGLALQAALIDWYSTTNGRPISSAAGNHVAGEAGPFPAFVPAQLARTGGPGSTPAFEPVLCAAPVTCKPGRLYDVQSVDENGAQSAFSNAGHFSAPGEHLVGVRLDTGTATIWSGSSFAAAVVTAAIADGAVLGDGSVTVLHHVTTK